MEPRKDQPKDAREIPEGEPKPRRFRIVKLEERIAPQAESMFTASLRPIGCNKSYAC
jgi:hypothetical protein